MKRIYHINIYTTEGKEFESYVDAKYDVKQAAEEITQAKPDAVIMIGDTFAIRAGEVRAIVIDGEKEEADE